MSVYNLEQIVGLRVYSVKSIAVVERLKLIAERIFQKRPLLFEVLSQQGINCLGGFSQVDYLTVMMERWRQFLRVIGKDEESEVNAFVPTRALYGDMGLAFAAVNGDMDGSPAPASFLDILLRGDSETRAKIAQKARSLSLAESIILNFPELYRMLYSKKAREPELTLITQHDIIDALNLRIYANDTNGN